MLQDETYKQQHSVLGSREFLVSDCMYHIVPIPPRNTVSDMQCKGKEERKRIAMDCPETRWLAGSTKAKEVTRELSWMQSVK